MLDRAPATVELTVPRRTHLRRQPGIVVRRSDLSHLDLVGVRDIWVAQKPLVALETAVA